MSCPFLPDAEGSLVASSHHTSPNQTLPKRPIHKHQIQKDQKRPPPIVLFFPQAWIPLEQHGNGTSNSSKHTASVKGKVGSAVGVGGPIGGGGLGAVGLARGAVGDGGGVGGRVGRLGSGNEGCARRRELSHIGAEDVALAGIVVCVLLVRNSQKVRKTTGEKLTETGVVRAVVEAAIERTVRSCRQQPKPRTGTRHT